MAKAAKPIMKITGSFMVDWELKELFKKKLLILSTAWSKVLPRCLWQELHDIVENLVRHKINLVSIH